MQSFFSIWVAVFLTVQFCAGHLITAQTCLAEGIHLASQLEIDEFANKYPGCNTVLGTILIQESQPGTIFDLRGLAQLSVIQGSLQISNNRVLKTLSGLDNLLQTGNLSISSNSTLQNIQNLSSLIRINQSLRIDNNLSLTSISGLHNIRAIPGDVSISDNDLLPNLKGLDQLNSIGEHLIITSNAGLQNLIGLENLERIGQETFIKDNLSLKSLEALSQLKVIGKDLMLDNNPQLSDLQGLNQVASVGGNLLVVNNQSMLDLRGLESLAAIEGILQIFNNANLRSLAGIDQIDHTSITDLALLSSPMLSHCSVKSICAYLAAGQGTVSIMMNEEGCQTADEILDACPGSGPSTNPLATGTNIFFPNPTSGPLFIRGTLIKDGTYEIIDAAGKLVQQGSVVQNMMDLGLLAAGMYMVELQVNDNIIREAIIKM